MTSLDRSHWCGFPGIARDGDRHDRHAATGKHIGEIMPTFGWN
jgi:hypothetical protein